MKAVILAGGMGTRMREETEFKPKPMVEIGGRPVVWHIMRNFAHHGFTDFVICIGYKGEHIVDYFFPTRACEVEIDDEGLKSYSGRVQDWTITLVESGLSTHTGGRLLKAKRYLINEEFLCTYGDGLAAVDVRNLVNFHKENQKIATVTAVQPISRFGLLEIDTNHEVRSFIEKPKLHDWINGGYFCFMPSVFEYIVKDEPLELNPLSFLARDRELIAFKHEGMWQPMDTYREYVELNQLWNEKRAYWKTWNDE